MRASRAGLPAAVLTMALAGLALAVNGRAAPAEVGAASGSAAPRSPPPFLGPPSPRGVLRVWGPKAMAPLVALWASGFHRSHPDVTLQARLMGSDTAIPGLYSGLADIALLGRHDDVTDDNGFSRPKGYPFRRIKLMSGSLDTPGESPALAILVSAGNPVSRLTLAQLAGIAGCPCAKPARAVISTWGQLGATGSWTRRPVHVYIVDAASGTGRYFLRTVLGGSRAPDWSRVSEFHDRRRADGTLDSAAAQTAAAVRRDPYGVAVSTLRYLGRGLKVVAIAARAGGPFVVPDRTSVIDGAYPLARSAYAFIDQPPGRSIARKVREFLLYALSPQGQLAVARAGGYLPLDRAAAAHARGAVRSWGANRQAQAARASQTAAAGHVPRRSG